MINNDLIMPLDIFELEDESVPSKTYHVEESRIVGTIDGLTAIGQLVDKILRTERFVYPIYTEYFGAELERFIGQDFDFAQADLERSIEEALKSDDRIEGISDFELEQVNKQKLAVTFSVQTIFGSYTETREIDI